MTSTDTTDERRRTAEAALLRVALLHHKQTAYYAPESDFSYDTPDEAAEDAGCAVDNVESFDYCAACAEMEQGEDPDPRELSESLWPCATVRVMEHTLAEPAPDTSWVTFEAGPT